jgi:hypothetical protein
MEIKKATISRSDNETLLVLEFVPEPLKIVLTDDNPNNVKTVFNVILKKLKNGIFEFELDDDKQDLFHHICTEYILQLNSELKAVYQELTDFGLTVEAEQEDTNAKNTSDFVRSDTPSDDE